MTDRPIPEKDEKGRFVTGNIGGGRPKGSRNKLGEAFVEALQQDFDSHGKEAIEKTRLEKPAEYLRVIASLLPREFKIEAVNDLTDDELDSRIAQLASLFGIAFGASEALGGEEAEAGAPKAH